MNSLTWDNSFSVRVLELDTQHKIIFDIINKIGRLNNLDPNSELVSQTLTQLREYTEVHFKTEESYMEKIGHIDLDKHRQLHNEFKVRIAEFCMDAVEGRRSLHDDLINFLNRWWTSHILIQDMRYSRDTKDDRPG